MPEEDKKSEHFAEKNKNMRIRYILILSEIRIKVHMSHSFQA